MSVKKKENQILQWFVKPINSIFRNNSCSPNFASKQRYKIRPFIFSFSRLKEQVNIKKKIIEYCKVLKIYCSGYINLLQRNNLKFEHVEIENGFRKVTPKY